jgi:hypothetical protein
LSTVATVCGACEIAGIEPRFETIKFETDDEARAFVKSRSERRDLTKGEKAMALAMLYPEPEKGGRGKHGAVKEAKKVGRLSDERLRQARLILRHSPPLAIAVRDGVTKLDEALAQVKAERANLDTSESRLARLRAEAPDLANHPNHGNRVCH